MMKKYILPAFLAISALPLFSADWAPLTAGRQSSFLQDVLSQSLRASKGGSPQRPVNYITLYAANTQLKNIPNPQEAMDAWFKNVLSYRDSYPGFEEVFNDILPVLERGIILKEDKRVEISPNGYRAAEAIIERYQNEAPLIFFYTPKRALLPCGEKFADKTNGCRYKAKNGVANIVAVFIGPVYYETPQSIPPAMATLIHELGHVFNLGDLYEEGLHNADLRYGSGVQDSVMNSSQKGLTCDDADALIGTIDNALGNERAFNSFCGNGYMYQNNKYTQIKQPAPQHKQQLADALKTAPGIKGFQP